VLAGRGIGRVFVRGGSVMHSYFRDEESTRAVLSEDGWLDTGDMGYLSSGYIFIVGRAKDMIIINGRNHWPQDIEWAVEQLPGFKSGDIAAFATRFASAYARSPALLRSSSSSRRERCRAPARASCRGPRRATFISPAKSSLTTSPLERPGITRVQRA
jgi:fatty-acyl-CoA synthase